MSEVNFSVRLSEDRSNRVNAYTSSRGLTNKAWLENIIDRLRPALDVTSYTPKRVRAKMEVKK